MGADFPKPMCIIQWCMREEPLQCNIYMNGSKIQWQCCTMLKRSQDYVFYYSTEKKICKMVI